jgi:hypothetical protein
MASAYSSVVFKNSPLGITANKLNQLVDDLSTAIGNAGGGGTGSGDMTKAVYDTDGNGIVDTADSIPWSKVTGKPAALGDMTKAVYDTNNDGISDHAALADAVPWTGVTGKPSTFPPDSTAMLKATYDVNGDGITDHAALADSAPWAGITGKPATFPPDSTAMLKSVYDANADNIVDHAALADTATNATNVPWTGVIGKPLTFPPDSTAMLKSVYDTNGDGISDHAALADAAPWAGITGAPASFTPSVHASTHVTGGTDIIGPPTTSSTGLVPALPAAAPNSKFLRGDGSFVAVNYTLLSNVPASFIPSAHAATHLDNGTDVIPVVTATRTGLAPKLSGNAATYLDGTGVFSSPGGLVNPGTWTNLSLGTGWTAPTQAQYRVEVNGAVSIVHFRGMIQAAYSALGTTAFTAPAGALPSMTRSAVLGGAQNTGSPSDIASYLATVSSAGVCTIYFLCAAAFVWADPSKTQQVYLDGFSYSL